MTYYPTGFIPVVCLLKKFFMENKNKIWIENIISEDNFLEWLNQQLTNEDFLDSVLWYKSEDELENEEDKVIYNAYKNTEILGYEVLDLWENDWDIDNIRVKISLYNTIISIIFDHYIGYSDDWILNKLEWYEISIDK